MNDKKNMLFYSSWLDIIEKAPGSDIDKYHLILSLLKKGLRDEEIPTDIPLYSMFQEQAFAQIDSAQEKHERRVEAGRKGGQNGSGDSKRRLGNKNASKTQANENVNVNVNVNDNDKDINIIASPIDLLEGQGSLKYQNAEDMLSEWRQVNE